jgi:hypothetical protein
MSFFDFSKNDDTERPSELTLQWNFNFGNPSQPVHCQDDSEDGAIILGGYGTSECTMPTSKQIVTIPTSGVNATKVRVFSTLTPDTGETLVGVDIQINGTVTNLNSTSSYISNHDGYHKLLGYFPGGTCNEDGTASNFLILTPRWYDGGDENVFYETIGFFGECARLYDGELTGYKATKVDEQYRYPNVLSEPETGKNFDVGHTPYPLLNQDGHNILSVPDEAEYTSLKIAAQPEWTHGGFTKEITSPFGETRDTAKIRTRFETANQKTYGDLYVVQYRSNRVGDKVETFKRRITSTDIEQTEPITGLDPNLPVYVVPNDIAYITDGDPVPDHQGKIVVIVQPIE